MKKALHMIGVLTAVALLSGLVLSFTNAQTWERIEANRKAAEEASVLSLFPGARIEKISLGEGEDAFAYYEARDDAGNRIGYTFKGAGNGYQGVIELMIAVSDQVDSLVGFRVLESNETPGLGAKIQREGFQSQFKGLNITGDIRAVTSGAALDAGRIDSITGATISSRAVVKILNEAIEDVRARLTPTGQE